MADRIREEKEGPQGTDKEDDTKTMDSSKEEQNSVDIKNEQALNEQLLSYLAQNSAEKVQKSSDDLNLKKEEETDEDSELVSWDICDVKLEEGSEEIDGLADSRVDNVCGFESEGKAEACDTLENQRHSDVLEDENNDFCGAENNSQSPFSCDYCDYKTNMRESLRQHTEVKHKGILYSWDNGNIVFSCNQCNYKTKSKYNLNSHVDSKHNGVLHMCSQCDKKFMAKSSLSLHIKVKHSMAEEYQCEHCNYVTKIRNSLRRHTEMMHLGIVYSCDQCDYKTKDKGALKRHADIKHRNVIYSCEQCDYTAKYKSAVKDHVAAKHNHAVFTCDQCQQTFEYRASLHDHIKVKHSDIVYSCDQCEYKTKRSYSLKRHRDGMHLGILYSCQLCDYTAKEKGALKRHADAKHKAKSNPHLSLM